MLSDECGPKGMQKFKWGGTGRMGKWVNSADKARTGAETHRTRLNATVHIQILSIILHIMSRASTSTARPLSLTEELEKLEQQITLTLQGTKVSLIL
jgi:hypothetical protein